jgi:hypothetical protein
MDAIDVVIKELDNYEYETDGSLVTWLWENAQQVNINEIMKKISVLV